MHIIGQQLDHIEEKIVEKTPVSKIEKPLIDLPSQNGKLKFKTSQAKTLDIVEKMLSDLKVKTECTSTSAAYTISRNEKEIVSNENTDSDSLFSVFAKKMFLMMIYQKLKDLLEIPNPCLLQKLVFKTYSS